MRRLRKLSREEHVQTRQLYEEVFQEDSKEFTDYYYKEKTVDNEIYVIEEDKEIQAMLHLNPYLMHVNGREWKVHYIVAVATRASCRKRGYMRELLTRALRDMYEAGEPFTYLMPAAEAIYLPYDFVTVYEQRRSCYKDEDTVSPYMDIHELRIEECRELAETANQYLKEQYQVFAVRSAFYYERLRREYAADGGRLMLYRKDGVIADCRPCVTDAEGDRPVIMVRTVDLNRMLMSLSLTDRIGVCFTVTDPVIAENNRCVVLTGSEQSGIMTADGRKENSEGTIPISVLSELIFGACPVSEACRKEGVQMSARMRTEFHKIMPLSRMYINEVV